MEYKTERKTFRFSQKELMMIEKKAEKAKLTLSEYIRQSALDKNIIIIEDLKEFTKELRAIGKNLNQLTILSHQGKITCLNLDTIEKQIIKIWEQLDLLTIQIKR